MVFLPVGILQAICSTIGGLMSDKMNPKIPLIGSIILFAYSFYLNSQLSMNSEHAQIMLPLYLRGASMGFLFTSLSTMSLVGISHKDMAQASGLMNVMRQIGGSLGVAFFQTLLTQRIMFHQQINSASINVASPVFTHIQHGIMAQAQNASGFSPLNAIAAGKAMIMSHISMQSYVQGINDDFLVSTFCTIVCIIPVLFLNNHRQDF
jgi:DHA2 family multidrug resistance protein